jgi:hypothetical protein
MKIIAEFLRQDILEMSEPVRFNTMLHMVICDGYNRTEGR